MQEIDRRWPSREVPSLKLRCPILVQFYTDILPTHKKCTDFSVFTYCFPAAARVYAEGRVAEMTNDDFANNSDNGRESNIEAQMEEALTKSYGPLIARQTLSMLGGIPVIGGLISGAASAWSEAEQDYFNRVAAAWLKLQQDEIREIGRTVAEILSRLDLNDPKVRKRIESHEYLSLIKKAFRDWSAAESEAKRILVRTLLTNAAVNKICTDDVVRMFIKWIDDYSELHFKVIRWIYKNPGSTRYDIWMGVHGAEVREDSAEADMFKLLIRDLSTGSVIRQHREKDWQGNWKKKTRTPRRPSLNMKSAFDDEEEYELTEFGKQFVRYTMEDVMPRIAGATSRNAAAPTSGSNNGIA